MSSKRHFLTALKYPLVESFRMEDEGSVQALVLWLENFKIRSLDTNERSGLRNVADRNAWNAALNRYLKDQGCPVDDPSNNLEESIDWLLSQAILLEYKDRRQELLHTRPPEAQRTTHGSGSTFHDVSSDEFKDSVIVLGQALGIVTEGKELSEILREANERLSTLQNPAFQFSAKQHAKLYAKDTSAIIPSEEAESLPLGFQTGDATVDSAATLLRLLYVRDLRKLQSSIDQTIVQIQEWTSNPKTDATLGKVGR